MARSAAQLPVKLLKIIAKVIRSLLLAIFRMFADAGFGYSFKEDQIRYQIARRRHQVNVTYA